MSSRRPLRPAPSLPSTGSQLPVAEIVVATLGAPTLMGGRGRGAGGCGREAVVEENEGPH